MNWEKILVIAAMGAATIIFTVSMRYLTTQACQRGDCKSFICNPQVCVK